MEEKKNRKKNLIFVQLLATDISALATMKNAANCDKLMRIAELSESSNFWTHIALLG